MQYQIKHLSTQCLHQIFPLRKVYVCSKRHYRLGKFIISYYFKLDLSSFQAKNPTNVTCVTVPTHSSQVSEPTRKAHGIGRRNHIDDRQHLINTIIRSALITQKSHFCVKIVLFRNIRFVLSEFEQKKYQIRSDAATLFS